MTHIYPKRSLVVPMAILVLAVGCAGPEVPELSGAAAGWNVLLLSVDTVRADHLGAYGYRLRDTSPRIDELITSGVRCERAMAPRAKTWPSLASVLTGLYPTGHGVMKTGYELPPDLPTLPRILRSAGYQTGAFISNMCRAGHQGWDELMCTKGRDRRATRRALAWVAASNRSRPFFLWVHYLAAHGPYAKGGRRARRDLDPGYDGFLKPRSQLLDRIMREKIPLDEADRHHLGALYDAAIMGTDARVGELLDGLAADPRWGRTLVVFLADHGEDLYQHHEFLYHACSVYQSGLRVPLAFIAPDLVPAGTSVAPPVELIDVAPTILDLLGLGPPDELHGRSLVPDLRRPEHARGERPAFSEFDHTRIRTVLAGDWKLIDNPDRITPRCFPDPAEFSYPISPVELYDLGRDPAETRNLAAEHPAKVAALRALIGARFAPLTDRKLAQEIPEELKAQLRALGYVAD